MITKLGACGCAAWWGTDETQKYYQSHCHTVAGPLIDKADELPVHNRKGVGNLQKSEKEKGRGGGGGRVPAVVPQGDRSHCHGRRSPYSAFQKTTMCYKKCANKVQPFTFGAVPLFNSKKSDVLLSQ